MGRQPCTCSTQYELCPSCREYEARQRKSRDGTLVTVYGKKRHSAYTLEQIVTAKSMWKNGHTNDSISVHTGIACGSVRYVLTMEILEDSISEG